MSEIKKYVTVEITETKVDSSELICYHNHVNKPMFSDCEEAKFMFDKSENHYNLLQVFHNFISVDFDDEPANKEIFKDDK